MILAILAAAAVQTTCISSEDLRVLRRERDEDFSVGSRWTKDAADEKARRFVLSRAHLASDGSSLEDWDREQGGKLLAVAKAIDHTLLILRACKP